MSDIEKAVDATLDLASENQRLRERVAELEAEVPYVTDLRAANGQLDMTIQGAKSTLSAMATALAKSFEADGGINYVQYEVRSGDKDFVLTLQRSAGKTPHQLRQEAESRATKAEAERDAALAQVAVLRGALEAADSALRVTIAPLPEDRETMRAAQKTVRTALASTPTPTLDYSGLCAAPSCEGHCGYVHARGCEAVREYLADHGGDPYRAPSTPDILRRVAERAADAALRACDELVRSDPDYVAMDPLPVFSSLDRTAIIEEATRG